MLNLYQSLCNYVEDYPQIRPFGAERFPDPHLPRNLWNKINSPFNETVYKPRIINSTNYQHLYAFNHCLTTGALWRFDHLHTWHKITPQQPFCNTSLWILHGTETNNTIYAFSTNSRITMFNTINGTHTTVTINNTIPEQSTTVLAAAVIRNQIHAITLSKQLPICPSNQMYHVKHQVITRNNQATTLHFFDLITEHVVKNQYNRVLIKINNNRLCKRFLYVSAK